MRKKTKIIFLIILFIFLITFMQVSYADSFGLGDLEQYRGTAKPSESFNQKMNRVFFVIRLIGTVLSVIILTVIGIKYLLGSVEEKAEYKKTLMPYIYGAFFLFTGTLIPQLIFDLLKGLGAV